MLDAEAVVEHRPRGFEQGIGRARGRCDEMRGQRRLGRAQRPDVKVVDGVDAVELAKRASTSSSSIPLGTPISDIQTDSCSSPMLPHRMTAATARLITGSTQCWPVHKITSPANTTAGRDRRVGGHVQKGAADVDVALAAAREQQGGEHR